MILSKRSAARPWVWLGLGLLAVGGLATSAAAQDGFQPASEFRYPAPPSNLRLSEATAYLEQAVREMYLNIEPGRDTSPNELLAYADLRVLRLYAGALEVAGWSLEQSAIDYQRYSASGAYRPGRPGRPSDPQAEIALDRYRAYRETVRTLLYRVRTTAVAVEHQVSFCDPTVARDWRTNVLPALRDTISSTDSLFSEEIAYHRYGIPGQTSTTTARVVPTSGSGIPGTAVEVSKFPTYAPYDKQGRGQGRYFEVRSFGGPVRIKGIRFRSYENAFGAGTTSVVRELALDQIVNPGQPVFIACNRKRWVDMGELEVEWESSDRNRRAYATIELVEASPDDPN